MQLPDVGQLYVLNRLSGLVANTYENIAVSNVLGMQNAVNDFPVVVQAS
jgi:hypothetical protein